MALQVGGLWAKDWSCIPSKITINGTYVHANPSNGTFSCFEGQGESYINACIEGVSDLAAMHSQRQILSTAANAKLPRPFSESITPLIVAVASTVTMAYVLFFVTLIAQSKRPWLQRGAALGVVVALTLVADQMYSQLRAQHNQNAGYVAKDVRDVRTHTAFKVIRLMSNVLLWLAQVQVLIRLFPRHRDKIVIKWTALGLIVLEMVFAVLNDFYHPSPVNPNSMNPMVPAIPVLSYLFLIAIEVFFAFFVLFYSLTSGRWRHAYCPNNLAIALLSFIAICTPTTFFCLDIWQPVVTGWGDYVRSIGTLAESILVWDWVDRIEAMIEKDSKSGVLGREVFEDEMNDQKKTTRINVASTNFRRRWGHRQENKDRVEEEQGLELPIIHHPIVRSQNSQLAGSSTLRPSQSSQYAASQATSQLDTTSHTGSRRDLAAEHARQNQPQSHESGIQEEESIPAHFLQPDTASFVHRGFSSGDYWQDEKNDTG